MLVLSVVEPLTNAESVAVPAVVCNIVTVIVTLDPFAMEPRLQPAVEEAQLPLDGVATCSLPVEGICIARATSVAVCGPLFLIVTVYVEFDPVVVSPEDETVTARSAISDETSCTLFERSEKTPLVVWNARPFLPQRTSLCGYSET